MKKLNLILALIFLVVSSGTVMAAAPAEDPLTVGAGARPMAMGLAFVALADDANASFINPAGLGGLKETQITSMYGNLMGDISYMLFGAAFPCSWGTFGLSYMASNSSDIPFTTLDGSGRVVANGTFGYDSNLLMLSYGKDLSDWVKNLSAGANVKMFSRGFSQVSAAGSLNTDIGLLYKATDWLNLGFARQNTLGTALKWGNGAESDALLANNKFGLTVMPPNWPVLASLDLDWNSKAKLFHVGAEWKAFRNDWLGVALRIGVEQKLNASLGKSNDLSFGAGLEMGNFGFDYAYQSVYDEPSAVTHYFSFSYKFGGCEKAQKVAQLIKS